MADPFSKQIISTLRRPGNIIVPALLFLLISLGCFLHAWLSAQSDLDRLKTKEQLCLNYGSDAVYQELDNIRKDLIFFSQAPELHILLNEPGNEMMKKQLEEGLTAFIRSKKIYDQIRYIGESGWELIRINYNSGNPYIVPRDKLQDKSKRYYFIDTMKLEPRKIYFSPIDLNIEHKKIEHPYKPMLRIATPLFADNGNRRGIIVLNYFARNLFARFQQELSDLGHSLTVSGQTMVLNRNGFWLLAPDPADEWGFMLNDRKSFAGRYPAEWQKIKKSDTGLIMTENGMFSFKKLSSLQGSGDHPILLSYIPAEQLQSFISPLSRFPWTIFWAIVVILLPLVFFLLVQLERDRQTQKKISNDEIRFRLLYEQAPIPYQSLDGNGLLHEVNQSWLDILGYKNEEVIGRSFFNFISPETAADFQEKFNEFMTHGRSCKTELKLRKKDGTDILVSFSGNISTDPKGNFLQTHCVFSDVTKLRLKEERISHLNLVLKTIMQIQQLIMAEKNGADLIRRICDLLTGNRGYNSARIILLDNKMRISHAAYSGSNCELNLTKKNIETGRLPPCINRLKKEVKVKIFPDRYKLCKDCPFADKSLDNSVMAALLSYDDDFSGFMVVLVDRNLLVDHEEQEVFAEVANDLAYGLYVIEQNKQRQKMEAQLMLTEKMTTIAGLAAGVAHEINTPLSGIMQSAQIIEEGLKTDDPVNLKAAGEYKINLDNLQNYLNSQNIFTYIKGIRDSAAGAAKIIKSLLRFSRPGQTKSTVTSLTDILDSAVLLARSDYDMKKKYIIMTVEFVREYGRETISLSCVSMEIEQVILNLLKNAAQSLATVDSPGFKPRIVLRAFKKDGMVRIEVEDNGPGIDQATMSKIFDPFFTTKDVGAGTGLGLYISYNIICGAYKGKLWVESSPGEKTTFFIELPGRHKES